MNNGKRILCVFVIFLGFFVCCVPFLKAFFFFFGLIIFIFFCVFLSTGFYYIDTHWSIESIIIIVFTSILWQLNYILRSWRNASSPKYRAISKKINVRQFHTMPVDFLTFLLLQMEFKIPFLTLIKETAFQTYKCIYAFYNGVGVMLKSI